MSYAIRRAALRWSLEKEKRIERVNLARRCRVRPIYLLAVAATVVWSGETDRYPMGRASTQRSLLFLAKH